MSTQVNLSFVNNQIWLLVYDMSQWALLYDLTQGEFAMQARVSASDVLPVYQWTSSNVGSSYGGTIVFDPTSKLLLISAPYDDMKTMLPAGAYVHDLQYTLTIAGQVEPILVRDMASGTLTVFQGVTRT